ncbi:hypothetical protein A3Q56_06659 [Intoshia linei]|uniref:Uncharacterized protein n=1 Tax=Intoshia linei TaxID=1819745 RepID=A0A177AWL6_9BILA|nr:hypothetical protein A3Q56_06659 [Intoshia linei]
MHKYFAFSIGLYKDLNVLGKLNSAGITPKCTSTYTIIQLTAALPSNAVLLCQKLQGKDYLIGIQFCVKLNLSLTCQMDTSTIKNLCTAPNIYFADKKC